MKILIFGGAGFVGRHYAKYFLKKNYRVKIVDNLAPLSGATHPKKWSIFNPYKFRKKFEFIKQDCRKYFEGPLKENFELIINLAAIVGGREVIENNPFAVAEDIEIDTAFWRWAIKNKKKIQHVITYSSSAAYPINLQKKGNYRLLKETDLDLSKDFFGKPDLSYGWAKLNNEYLAKLAYEKYSIKNTIFRPFSGYGADQDLNYPFPSIVKRALNHNQKHKFIVWGTGLQMRDFIHIDDVIRGSLIISKKVRNGQAVNLSSGKYLNFINLAKKIFKRLDKKNIKINGNSSKPEGVFARGGSRFFQRKLGFEPQISIEKGIDIAIDYFKKHN